jgi:protein ImuB
LHEVARAEGPERIAMEWWKRSVCEPVARRGGRSDSVATPRDPKNDSDLTRDYFRIETDTGQRFWLYRDGLYHQTKLAPRWYLQGIFS